MKNSEALESYMAEAISLAETGMRRGDGGPFGALIVKDNQIIGRGWNRVLSSNDPTAHAEIVAIRDACTTLGSYRLTDCAIYVNCEPCPMCLGAIYWAHLEALYYGATRADAAAIGFDDDYIYNELARPHDQRALRAVQHARERARQGMLPWTTLEFKRPY